MIKTEQAHLLIEAASHPGMTGKKNEDRYGVTSFIAGPKDTTSSVLAVLCDGIGGHRAGEVAAHMGVSIITETVAVSDVHKPLKTLQAAIKRASESIYEASQSDQGRSGMGATCACVWVIGEKLYTANLGDSRIYLLREGHLLQLTTDHTWIQEALDAGIIADTDRESHPNAHVIRRYLGSKAPPQPDFRLWYFEEENDAEALSNQGLKLLPDDILLVCSDGLTDLVSDEEILNVISENPLADVSGILIDMANNRGGHDNITLILMQVPPDFNKKAGGSKKRRWLAGCVLALFFTSLLITAVLFGLRLWGDRFDGTAPETPQMTLTLPTAVTTETLVNPTTILPTDNPTQLPGDSSPQPTLTPWPTNTPAP